MAPPRKVPRSDQIAALTSLTVGAIQAELPEYMVTSDDVLAESVTTVRSAERAFSSEDHPGRASPPSPRRSHVPSYDNSTT